MAIETPDFQSVTVAPATHLATVNLAAGPSSQTINVQPPPGTHALGFTTNLLDGEQTVGLVQGHVSGANYWNGSLIIANPTNGRPAILPIFCDPSFENSFEVNVGNQGIGPARIEIFAVRDTEAVSVLPAYPGPTLGAAALSVILASDSPSLPIPAPTSAATVDWAAGAGGILHPIGAVAGKVIRVWGLSFWFDAAAAAGSQLHFQDTAASQFWKVPETSTVPPSAINLGGFPLGIGLGLDLKSDAAVAVRGMIQYSQT